MIGRDAGPEAAATTAAGQWGPRTDGGILTLVRVVFDDSGGQPARMAAALRAPAHLPPLQPDRHPRLLDSLERIGRLAGAPAGRQSGRNDPARDPIEPALHI